MTGLAARRIADELMDAPDLDPQVYAAVLADLARVNQVTMAARPTLSFLERAIGRRQSLTLLDVGFGDGDMLRRIARWAAARGIRASLTGIDLNPNSVGAAAARTPPGLPIRYLAGDYAALGEGHDCIISSLVAHHMSEAELDGFLRYMETHARCGWIINDLHRHRLAYHGFPLLARIARWHPIVRHDGQLSVARAFRPHEWPAILARAGVDPAVATVERWFPFRLCVTRLR